MITFADATGSAPAARRVSRAVAAAGDEPGLRRLQAERRPRPNPRARQLRQLAAQPLDDRGLGLDRDEIRLGEVAVVVRLLFRAVRREPVGAGLVVVRVLLDGRSPAS